MATPPPPSVLSLVVGEDPVQGPAGLAQHAPGRGHLRGCSPAGDLTDRTGHLTEGIPQVEQALADVAADLLPLSLIHI